MAAWRGRALGCRGAGLRPRPERREERSVRAREGRGDRGGGLEAKGGWDGQSPGRGRPQGETLELGEEEKEERSSVRSLKNIQVITL